MDVVYGIVWIFLLFHGFTIAQNIHDIIANKEKQVRAMADEIVRLDAARCEFAANCSSSCSRDACNPIEGFDDRNVYNFTCLPMKENKYCSANSEFSGDCNASKVNYAMSYIMTAPNATIPEMCSTICMTRDFTSILKTMATEEQYYESYYFGSIEGVFRMFPGEERREEQCSNFDPRRRPWYKSGISVQKHLLVLIDHSIRAGQFRVPSPLLFTALDASKRIVHEIIQTLSSNDVIDVIAFNETDATTMTPNPISIGDDIGVGLSDHGEKKLDDCITNITATEAAPPTPHVGGFLKGISTALQADNYKDDYLRVILVFTNGEFAKDLGASEREQISAELTNSSTNLMIYSFQNSQNLRFLANNCRGYYELINTNFENPLYQISSFFNLVALARKASKDEPYWTNFYEDFSGRGNITTVSHQALNQKGHLLGVVGIDIVLQSLLADLPTALQDRFGSRPTNPKFHLDTQVGATDNDCGSCNTSNAVCPRTSHKSFTELYCCDTCNAHTSKKWSAWKISLATVLPVLAVLTFLIIGIWWRRRRQSPKPLDYPDSDVGPYK